MSALAANFVMQTVFLATAAQPYAEAYRDTEATGRPLLVLVSADWCPACQKMKHSTLDKMDKQGKLKQVAFSILDADEDATLSRQIMRGSSIPQLVLYERTSDGWRRTQITGAASERAVEAFISRAVAQEALLKREQSSKTAHAGGGG